MGATPTPPIMETESGLPPAPAATVPSASAPAAPAAPAALAAPVQSIPLDKKERITALLQGRVLNAVTGMPSSKLSDTIQQHYQQRIAEARMHQQNAQTLASILATGRDPKTGAALTPEQEAEYQHQYDAAMAAYQKAAGVDKASKEHVNKAKQFVDHIITLGRQRRAQAGTTVGPGGSAAAAPAGAVSGAASPAAVKDPGMGGLPPAPAGTPATTTSIPGSQQSALPPAPEPTMTAQQALAVPELQREMTSQNAIADKVAEQKAVGAESLAERRQSAQAAGLQPGTREYEEFLATGKFPTGTSFRPQVLSKQVSGADLIKADPSLRTVTGEALDPAGRYDVVNDPASGTRYATPSGMFASQLAAPKAVGEAGGPPVGITRNGKFLQPGDAEWAPADQKQLDAMRKSYDEANAAKDRRMAISARVRADAYARSRVVSVIDKDTGELVETTAADVASNPSKYAGASTAVQAMQRDAIFQEIGTSADILQKSINDLGDSAFDASSRAQMATVLRDADPRSALSTFLNSTAASTLTDQQVAYVTALANLEESAMSLRTVAGMGQGSDMLRSAIVGMLPGAATPSRAYANRQLSLFRTQVGQLHKGLPGLGATVRRGNLPNAPATSTQLPDGGGKTLDAMTAKQFLDAAGGDKDAARKLAKQHNWKF